MSSHSAPPGLAAGGQEEGRQEAQPLPPSSERSILQPDAASQLFRCNALLLSFLTFWLIVFGVWVVSAGSRYREEYAQVTEGWHVGSTRMVELTVVKEDKQRLACAFDHPIAGLRCGYQRDRREVAPPSPRVLQPYNTVANELLLGAGLWDSPDLKEPLPSQRFTVVCNYHVLGVAKSVGIRFDPTAAFSPLGRTVAAGTLTDCVIPR